MKPSLIVHGGAWDIPDEAIDACKSGCQRALAAGWSILSRGGSALDAGYGSHLNLDGQVECDAIVMDGVTLHAGAAATLHRVKNPIQLARKILENCPHMMLVAEGAERFAKEHGIRLCKPEELISEAEHEAWRKCKADKHAAGHHRGHEQGTVGAVALDANGKLFAGTSTGGTCCKLPGRVGDSPLIGCGCYADSEAGGVSCTGYGEAIMKVVMAKSAVDFLCRPETCVDTPPNVSCGTSSADLAARQAVHVLAKRTPTAPAGSSSLTPTVVSALRSIRRAWPTATSTPMGRSSPPSSDAVTSVPENMIRLPPTPVVLREECGIA